MVQWNHSLCCTRKQRESWRSTSSDPPAEARKIAVVSSKSRRIIFLPKWQARVRDWEIRRRRVRVYSSVFSSVVRNRDRSESRRLSSRRGSSKGTCAYRYRTRVRAFEAFSLYFSVLHRERFSVYTIYATCLAFHSYNTASQRAFQTLPCIISFLRTCIYNMKHRPENL